MKKKLRHWFKNIQVKIMIDLIEKGIETALKPYAGTVKDAMAYSINSNGKRTRPKMLLTLLDDLNVDVNMGVNAAVALEMIHTYSLVHDDLPAMDNDDFRRHKPTNHKVYGENMAILAGDGLLTASMNEVLNSKLKPEVILSLVEILSRNAGAQGMILGQEIDIQNNFNNFEDLTMSYQLKTGCLFASAFEMAVVIADRSDLQSTMRDLAYRIGIAFQYQDDILEIENGFELMGKSGESDSLKDKKTIVSFLGIEEANKLTISMFNDFSKELQAYPKLKQLLIELLNRKF